MATRVIISDPSGAVLSILDGHHGAAHAERWAGEMVAMFAAQGIDAIAVELTPELGGDEFRRDVLERAGKIRIELHQRPDGQREITSLSRRDTLQRIRGGLRLVCAPSDVIGDRAGIRRSRTRLDPDEGAPATTADARLKRKRERAQQRATSWQ